MQVVGLPTGILFPGSVSGKDSTYHYRRCKRHDFDSWVGKIPGGGNGNPLQYFLPGKFHEQRSLAGYIVHRVAKTEHTCTNLGSGQQQLLPGSDHLLVLVVALTDPITQTHCLIELSLNFMFNNFVSENLAQLIY